MTRAIPLLLLVEDDADEEALTLRVLDKLVVPFEVATARSGEDALDFLFATGAHRERDVHRLPALVLLDLQLPRIDGCEVLRRIRGDERTRLVPVVMLSSSSEPEDVQRCHVAGANSYIRKPIDFREFYERVTLIGTYWLSYNEPPG